MVVVGAGHGGKYKIIPSEMPELIRVSLGCELTSYQTSGILSCHEAPLNEKDGGRRKGWGLRRFQVREGNRQGCKGLVAAGGYLVIGMEKSLK